MIVTFDSEKMIEVKQGLDGLFLTSDTVDNLEVLEKVKEEIETLDKEIREIIKEKCLAFDANFKSLSGDKVRISLREFGSKYEIDESKLDIIPQELWESDYKIKVKTDAVDSYLKNSKGLPDGIVEPERKKTISITIK